MALVATMALALAPVSARENGSVAATIAPVSATVARGAKGTLTITLAIKPGWHVYAADPGSENYIPTTITAPTGAKGFTFGKPQFPKPTSFTTSLEPKPLNVYEEKAVITLPFTVAKNAKPGKHTLTAKVGYQTCNEQSCLPPDTVPLTATVIVK